MDKILTIAWNMVKRTIGTRKGVLIYILLPCIVLAGIVSVTGTMGRILPLCCTLIWITGLQVSICSLN